MERETRIEPPTLHRNQWAHVINFISIGVCIIYVETHHETETKQLVKNPAFMSQGRLCMQCFGDIAVTSEKVSD